MSDSKAKMHKIWFPCREACVPPDPLAAEGGRRPAVNLKVHTYTRSFANIPIKKEDLPFSLKITVLETSDSKQKNLKGTSNVSTYTTWPNSTDTGTNSRENSSAATRKNSSQKTSRVRCEENIEIPDFEDEVMIVEEKKTEIRRKAAEEDMKKWKKNKTR